MKGVLFVLILPFVFQQEIQNKIKFGETYKNYDLATTDGYTYYYSDCLCKILCNRNKTCVALSIVETVKGFLCKFTSQKFAMLKRKWRSVVYFKEECIMCKRPALIMENFFMVSSDFPCFNVCHQYSATTYIPMRDAEFAYLVGFPDDGAFIELWYPINDLNKEGVAIYEDGTLMKDAPFNPNSTVYSDNTEGSDCVRLNRQTSLITWDACPNEEIYLQIGCLCVLDNFTITKF